MKEIQKTNSSAEIISITPTFKLVFITVLGITVVPFFIACGLSFVENPTPLQLNLFETCSFSWKAGFGAIIGLIGGKIT